jgi:site-specific DNA-methyltransferase (adenine-specific)
MQDHGGTISMNIGSKDICIENGNDAAWCADHCTAIHLDSIKKGNSIDLLKCIKTASVDLLFADEPYNIGGQSGQLEWSGKRWKKINAKDQPWDSFTASDFDAFHRAWIAEAKRVLKPSGSLWASGTYHNIFKLGSAIQDAGFHVINDISWLKRNAFPRLVPNAFAASHETLIWAKPDKNAKHYFDYKAMKLGDFPEDNLKKPGKQMRSVWDIPKPSSESVGYPAQKPEKLLERIIIATSKHGDVILDPFLGSGTTAAVAKKLCRRYVGFDSNPDAIEKSTSRLGSIDNNNCTRR